MITLEYYELGKYDDEPLAVVYEAPVPRIGERVYIARTEKVLGVDPDKEHRYWKVIEVEYNVDAVRDPTLTLKYGADNRVAIVVKRETMSIFGY